MNIERVKSLVFGLYGKYRLSKYYERCTSKVNLKKLSKEQKAEARAYYKNEFGVDIDTKYHELLYSICGIFRPEFMPFDTYVLLIEKLSPYKYKKILDDKSLYNWILPNVKTPERVVFACNSVYYLCQNGGGILPITKSEALDALGDIENCIIKPSKDSSAGIGVRTLNCNNGISYDTHESIGDIIESYRGNFVVEKKIVNCENLKVLNPSSCNTLRVHTWRNKETAQIVFVSSFLRVGRQGSIIDNAFAGGIAIPLNEEGVLSNSGCTLKNYSRIEKSDTGITFRGYKIEDFDRIIDATITAHKNLPHFDFIGWDVTIDDKNEVVIIEFNPDPDMRLDQLIFMDTCLLSHQKEILKVVYK